MNWSDLPSLNSLKAFVAVAEAGGYSQAGTVLNVTHAAVSQQVKGLENRLGMNLVVREGRHVVLTDEGAALARDLAAGFDTIRRGIETVSGADAQRPVQVTTSPAFAVAWLMPRLVDFQHMHPDITLLLNPTADLVELKPGGIDVAIRYRDQTGSQEPVDVLLTLDLVVVATPDLIGDRTITDPGQLVDFPWLQELGTNEVADWLGLNGVVLNRPLIISHMPGNLIMDGVRRGDGLTYTPRPLVEEELKSGRLVELFCEKNFGSFHLKTQPGVQRKPVKNFIRWLKEQAAS